MNLFSHRIELIDHLSYDEDELLSYFKTSTFISRYSFDPPEAFLLAPILWNDNWDNLRNYPMINNIVKQIKEYKNHILSRHNREFTALEKDVIDNLKYEGKSK